MRLPRLSTLALTAGVWLALAGLACLDASAPATLRADFGITGVVVVVTTALNALFRLFGGSTVHASVGRILTELRRGIKDLFVKLTEFAVDIAKWFGKAWGVLKRFWERVLRPVLEKFLHLVLKLRDQLVRIFGPTLEFFQKLVREWRKFYNNVLRPILDVLGFIRQTLRVLSKFGIDFARKLEEKIGEIERVINDAYLLVLRQLNELVNTVNRIITLDGYLQRVLLMTSLVVYGRSRQRSWWNTQSKPLTPQELKDAKERSKPKTTTQISSEYREYVEFGSGPLAPIIRELAETIRIRGDAAA